MEDTPDVSIFLDRDFSSASFSVFEDMRIKEELIDCKIAVRDQSISVHRLVLAARIPLFRKYINSTRGIIHIKKEMDPSILESVINFAYTGVLKISDGTVRPLLLASMCLDITQIRNACWEFLEKRICPNNVWHIKELADEHHHLTLTEACDRHIKENFEAFSNSENFLVIPFSYLNKIIKSWDLEINLEANMFEAVVRWVKFSTADRKDLLPDLLRSVRMNRFTPEFLIERVSTEELVRTSIFCRDVVDEAKHYHFLQEKLKYPSPTPLLLNSETKSEKKESKSECPSPTPHLLNFEVKSGKTQEKPVSPNSILPRPIRKVKSQHESCVDSISNRVYAVYSSFVNVLDPESKEWNTLSTRNFTSVYHVVAFHEKIYVMCRRSTEILDLKSLKWYTLGIDNEFLDSSGIVLHNGKIYCFGGREDFVAMVLRLDLQKKTWITEGNMRRCRILSGVASFKERIFVIGGTFNDDVHTSVEQYIPQTRRWSSMAPMLHGRYDHGCTCMKGKIYVCGGRISETVVTNTAEMYDPYTNQWNNILPLESPQGRCCLTSHDGKLYTVGKHFGKWSRSMEIYDPQNKRWESDKLNFENNDGDYFVLTATVVQESERVLFVI